MHPSDDAGPAVEMPRYKSHKQVWALKIKTISLSAAGDATITPEEAGYAPFKPEPGYMEKHKPHAGGYYVVYDDGYKSFSPAKAFEEGYTPIDRLTHKIADPAEPRPR